MIQIYDILDSGTVVDTIKADAEFMAANFSDYRLNRTEVERVQMTQKQFVEGISADIRKQIRASADADVIDAWEIIRLQDVLEKDSQVFKDFLSAIVGANIITKKEAKNFWQ